MLSTMLGYLGLSRFHFQHFPNVYSVTFFINKSDEGLSLRPICLEIDFRYHILKYQCHVKLVFSTFKMTTVK